MIFTFYLLLFFTAQNMVSGQEKLTMNQNVQLTSEIFRYGDIIPIMYTCHGENKSPQLQWNQIENAQSYTLILEDPDAPKGTYVHWVLFNIPGNITELPEKILASKIGATDGINSAGKRGYIGPCPPPGMHRYFFTLYALNIKLKLGSNTTAQEVKKAMEGHIISQGSLLGLFGTQ